VASIVAIVRLVVGAVLEKLKTYPEWRILVMPDHPTNIATRKHGYAPTLFAMAGTRVHSAFQRPYNEAAAKASDLHVEKGHELMEYFLGSGSPSR
jgi:2,3-bisphosphoglycerate-independent phosphoglycerate mutase